MQQMESIQHNYVGKTSQTCVILVLRLQTELFFFDQV